jgi:hypothetical protein
MWAGRRSFCDYGRELFRDLLPPVVTADEQRPFVSWGACQVEREVSRVEPLT